MKNKNTKIVASALCGLLLSTGVALFGCNNSPADPPAEEYNPTKIVLMIGDGMGVTHVDCAQTYLEEGDLLNMKSFKYSGEVDPDSLTTLENASKASDSAAGATALATGTRVYNDYLSMDKEGNVLKTIAEYADDKGLGVGIVTTDILFEATPAAFYSHTSNRYNYVDIRSAQYSCDFDLFLGADAYMENLLVDDQGYYYKAPEVIEGEDYTNGYIYQLEQEKIVAAGYSYVTDYFELDMNCDKIFGAFPSIAKSKFKAPPSQGRLDGDLKNTTPCLSQLTEFAINFMEEKFPQGYFLMIEDNDIDVECENWNDKTKDKMTERYITGDMVECLLEFDRSIGTVKRTLEKSNEDYAIIVSADHATGSLVEEQGVEGIYSFWSSGHDPWANVPYFIEAENLEFEEVVLNTDIFVYMNSLIQNIEVDENN